MISDNVVKIVGEISGSVAVVVAAVVAYAATRKTATDTIKSAEKVGEQHENREDLRALVESYRKELERVSVDHSRDMSALKQEMNDLRERFDEADAARRVAERAHAHCLGALSRQEELTEAAQTAAKVLSEDKDKLERSLSAAQSQLAAANSELREVKTQLIQRNQEVEILHRLERVITPPEAA